MNSEFLRVKEATDGIGATQQSPKRAYHPELDGLRFMAFLAVFFHHAIPTSEVTWHFLPLIFRRFLFGFVSAAAAGVDLFFCLSAWLITTLLLKELEIRPRMQIGKFLMRRTLRVWPLYFVFILAAHFVDPLLGNAGLGRWLIPYLFFVGNWACVAWGYPNSVAAPLWSVSIEEQFYVSWPLLLTLAGPQAIKKFSAACLLIAVSTRVVVWGVGLPHPGVWCNTLARLDPIALGICLAAVKFRLPLFLQSRRLLVAATGLVLILASNAVASLSSAPSMRQAIVSYPVTALGCVALLIAAIDVPSDTLFGRFLRSSIPVFLGRISYGLYVTHMLAIALVRKGLEHFVHTPPVKISTVMVNVLLSLILTALMGVAPFRAVEGPFLNLKKRFQ